jgi:hypothetical protein
MYFFLGAMHKMGMHSKNLVSKTKMVPAKEKPVRPKVVVKPIPDPPKVQPIHCRSYSGEQF